MLGPAAVLAARTLPALLVATVFSGWLDVLPRRAALVALSAAGGLLISVPAAFPRAVPAIAASGLLGAVRAAYRSVHAAVIAESVARPVRLPLFGLSVFVNQVGQVGGVLVGASLTQAIGPRSALIVDAVSFFIAAAIFARLPAGQQRPRGPRRPATEGTRIIWRHPVLRAVAIVTSATTVSSNLPETLAPQLANDHWLPAVMAASAFGGAVFAFVVSGRRFLDRVANQMAVAAGLGVALALAAGLIAAGAPIWTMVVANALVGAGGGWLIGAQATFAHLAPVDRMGQVEATMVASNILASGLGVLILGYVAAAEGPAFAYGVAGAVQIFAVLTIGAQHVGARWPLVRR